MTTVENCAKEATPPIGYRFVREGSIALGDKVWNDTEYRWEDTSIEMVRDDVTAYFGIARKE